MFVFAKRGANMGTYGRFTILPASCKSKNDCPGMGKYGDLEGRPIRILLGIKKVSDHFPSGLTFEPKA